jgi:hypothetical protein
MRRSQQLSLRLSSRASWTTDVIYLNKDARAGDFQHIASVSPLAKVTDDNPFWRDTLVKEQVDLLERQIAEVRCVRCDAYSHDTLGARRWAKHAFLGGSDVKSFSTQFADDTRSHTGPVRPLRELADQSIGCNLFMHTLGVGGVCIHCDEPLLVAELLDGQSATLLG